MLGIRKFLSKTPLWDKETNEVVHEAEKYLPETGNLFEIGLRSGHNAIYLAEKGYTVDGIDLNKEIIADLKENLKEAGLEEKVNPEIANFSTYRFSKDYDGIVCAYVLHYLSKEVFDDAVQKIKDAVKDEGIVAIADFTQQGPMYSPDTIRYWLKSGELKEIFSDFEILFFEEREHTYRTGEKQMGSTMVARKR